MRHTPNNMTTIALDSSTDVCSAALLQDGKVIAERCNLTGSNHAALLPAYVQELQASLSSSASSCSNEAKPALDAIVLSEGPGSYTGLRIAASLAKGLCYGMEIPLLAVPTLAVIAHAALNTQHATLNARHSTFNTQHPLAIRTHIGLTVFCPPAQLPDNWRTPTATTPNSCEPLQARTSRTSNPTTSRSSSPRPRTSKD